MGYYTEKYSTRFEVWNIDKELKIDERAEKYDEDFFKEILKKEKGNFAHLKGLEKLREKSLYKKYYKDRAEAVSWLPKKILDEVADRRVLIHGYASERVYNLIKEDCEDFRAFEEHLKILSRKSAKPVDLDFDKLNLK